MRSGLIGLVLKSDAHRLGERCVGLGRMVHAAASFECEPSRA